MRTRPCSVTSAQGDRAERSLGRPAGSPGDRGPAHVWRHASSYVAGQAQNGVRTRSSNSEPSASPIHKNKTGFAGVKSPALALGASAEHSPSVQLSPLCRSHRHLHAV